MTKIPLRKLCLEKKIENLSNWFIDNPFIKLYSRDFLHTVIEKIKGRTDGFKIRRKT